MERVAASGQTPMLQEPVHVDIGQQWTCDAALRRAARVPLSAPALSIARRVHSPTMAYVSRSPPIIPDGQISRVRFETLAFFRRPSQVWRGLNAGPCMLTVRIQVIDGTGTFTLSDSQPCWLLTSLQPHYRAFITTANRSAPMLRLGTLASR